MPKHNKHTAGEWEVNGCGLIYAPPRDDDDESVLVADCSDIDGDFGSLEMQANAQLISAAPDLLEALIWMTGHAAAHEEILRDNNLLDGEGMYLADEAHTKARAAIKKAKGE